MITFEETKDYKLLTEIMSIPELYKLTYGKGTDPKDFKINKKMEYFLIKKDDLIIGCIPYKELTSVTLEVHLQVMPSFWHKKLSLEIYLAFKEFIKAKHYKKLLITTPAMCIHVLRLLQLYNFKVCGSIPGGVVYNNILQTLFLFEQEL